jgi:glycosyltransferase involved in cell wall biosynthesis
MRILLLHSSSDLYGASKIFLQTVQILQKQGHTCEVVLSNEGPLVDALKNTGAHVHVFNLGIIRRKYFNALGILNRIAKWANANKQLRKIIKSQKIELVYSNTTAVLIGAWVAKKYKLPHYWHVHEIIETPRFLHSTISWLMQTKTNKIICVSRAVEDHWIQGNSNLALKTIQIYNGIEPIEKSTQANFRDTYHIPSNAVVIGMAGRVHYWKGQDYFLDIAKQLLVLESVRNSSNASSYNIPPFYFIITGDAFPGYEYLVNEMQDFIEKNKLSHRLFYTGFEAQMDKFYSAIDVLVLPSLQPDPLPTVVLEAMQYGIPVAATPQGGALEMIVNNETGIFIPMTDNTEAAADIFYISHTLQQTETGHITAIENRKIMGEKAKQRVAQYFSKEAFDKNIISLFISSNSSTN